MSDGGREIRDTNKKKLSADDFSHSVAKIAVAQVCESSGFHGVHQSAIEAFSNVVEKYIHQAGKNATFYANLSNRSESNALDIIQGLEDLGLPQGFSGASDTNHCLAGSGVIREISRYVNEEGENPFAYKIPNFPIVRERKSAPSFINSENSPPEGHIPSWLPMFPEPHTYSDEKIDNSMKNIEPFREERDVDSSVVDNLQNNISCNGFVAPIAVDHGDAVKAKQVIENKNNPFLAPPLRFGEKEVSSVVIPPKLLDGSAMREIENYIPGFEVLSPVDKPMKSPLNLNNIEEVKEKDFPKTRATVQFKLKFLKKSSGNFAGVQIDESEEKYSFFEVNNDNHEKKRKAGEILKESMDIVEESAEL